MHDLDKLRSLVGNVTPEQLTYVGCAITDTLGAFMPVSGHCQYAITPGHTHPVRSFIKSFGRRCCTKHKGKIYESVHEICGKESAPFIFTALMLIAVEPFRTGQLCSE